MRVGTRLVCVERLIGSNMEVGDIYRIHERDGDIFIGPVLFLLKPISTKLTGTVIALFNHEIPEYFELEYYYKLRKLLK